MKILGPQGVVTPMSAVEEKEEVQRLENVLDVMKNLAISKTGRLTATFDSMNDRARGDYQRRKCPWEIGSLQLQKKFKRTEGGNPKSNEASTSIPPFVKTSNK